MDALEHCIRSRHIAERAIQRQGFAIDAPELIGEFKERLYLGSEAQLSVQLGPEQRLLSRAIAREQQPLARIVPDRESKHPLEPGNRVGAEALVEGHDCFDVATRAEGIAPRRCFTSQIIGVVDLAVTHHPDLAIGALERLIAGREIHDGEPAGADARALMPDDAFAIRPAVFEGRGHARDRFWVAQRRAPPAPPPPPPPRSRAAGAPPRPYGAVPPSAAVRGSER